MTYQIIMDIWNGEYSANHVARIILPKSEIVNHLDHELTAGNLVNIRADLAWGDFQSFDNRVKS